MNSAAEVPADPSLKDGFFLNGLSIEPETGGVNGPGGHESLDPKVMGVLVMLAQHAGHVVPRDELITRLWPGAHATDDALSRCVYELRRQLARAGGDDQLRAMIETVPKRGYRLQAAITRVQPKVAGHMNGVGRNPYAVRAMLLTLVGLLCVGLGLWYVSTRDPDAPRTATLPGLPAKSVAVLPFTDMSAGQDQAYLGDGIAEEILNRLTHAGNLKVISRTSSFSFRNDAVDIREIARKLGVDHVLEGSIRKSGDQIRVTAQLIAAVDNSHLWSETFDRKQADLFAVQDEIAASVATALQVTLAGGRPHGRMPATVGAHESYLQAQLFFHRRGPGDLELAARYYEEAVAADPGYARAWAALAGAYSLLRFENPGSAAALQEKQGIAAHKAVELDPNLAVAHARLAHFYYARNDLEAGRRHDQRAAQLDPNDLLVLGTVASTAAYHGRLDEAIEAWRKSVALDPRAVPGRINLAVTLAADARYEEALLESRRVLELSPNVGWHVQAEVVRMLIALQRFDEALTELSAMPPGLYRDHGFAMLHELPAHRAEAAAALRRLETSPRQNSREVVWLADTYTYLGMQEEALTLLQDWKENLANDKDDGTLEIWFLQNELGVAPFLKPLHTDPRWTTLLMRPGERTGS